MQLRGLVSSIAAVILLGLIGMDLGDGACDPLPLLSGDAVPSATAAEGQDACADFCVPDCFCCTTSAPAVRGFSLPVAWTASAGPDDPADVLTAGVQPVIDHIPLTAL